MTTIGRVRVLPYCTVVANIEINDRLLYTFIGAHYYTQLYRYIQIKRPELYPEFSMYASEDVIRECGADKIEFFFSDTHCTYIENIFRPLLDDSDGNWIRMWRNIKEIFGVSYYICSLMDEDFEKYKPDGHFEIVQDLTTGYINIGNIYETMMKLLSDPEASVYRQIYTESMAKFRLFSSLLSDNLWKPVKRTCSVM